MCDLALFMSLGTAGLSGAAGKVLNAVGLVSSPWISSNNAQILEMKQHASVKASPCIHAWTMEEDRGELAPLAVNTYWTL